MLCEKESPSCPFCDGKNVELYYLLVLHSLLGNTIA